LYLATAIVFIIVAIILWIADKVSKSWIVFVFAVLFVQVVITMEYATPRKYDNKSYNIMTKFIIMLFFNISITVMQFSYRSGLALKSEKPFYNSIIEMKDKRTIKTSDSLIFVGKTENYTFLYNKIVDAPEIISNDQILLTREEKNK
jgi:hypothetical protein